MGKKGHRDVNKKTIPQLQNTLWPIFSKWTKLNHSEDGEWCNCFTCGKSIQIGTSDCHGGHFIPRTYSPTKYEEGNVRPQCGGCNGYGGGKPLEFERNLRLEIGDQAVDDLKEKSLTSWKWNKLDLISLIEYYKQETENMLQ